MVGLAHTPPKKFSKAERNYHTTDQELLGVVRALTEWGCYLEGGDCTVRTDHNALIHLQTQPNLNRRQVRWLEFLTRFEPGLNGKYRPGKVMIADPLSRSPCTSRPYLRMQLPSARQGHSLMRVQHHRHHY